MRVYLAATPAVLAEAVRTGTLPASLPVHAVTPSLREWYTEGDTEELELAALLDAGASSVRVLAGEEGAASGRVRPASRAASQAAGSSGTSTGSSTPA